MNKERLGSMLPSLSFGNVCVPMTIEFFRVSLLEMYVSQ